MILKQESREAYRNHVLECYPEESVGVIVNGEYIPCKNTHPEPLLSFKLSGKERYEIEQKVGKIEAILHSHPYKLEDSAEFQRKLYNPVWPSVNDQQAWMADNITWGIVATDGEGISEINWLEEAIIPFDRRPFNWFTSDCFTLVRDWHRLNNDLVIPNFTREYEFWAKGYNTIEEGINSIPYAVRLPYEKADIGDVGVFAIGGEIVNHLGVISGSNEIMHQWIDRYIECARWDVWRRRCKYVVRFEKDKV